MPENKCTPEVIFIGHEQMIKVSRHGQTPHVVEGSIDPQSVRVTAPHRDTYAQLAKIIKKKKKRRSHTSDREPHVTASGTQQSIPI
jgi:hypothetical protein